MSRLTIVAAHLFLGLLCVLCYYNSLRNEFAFDDYLAIVNNPDVMYGSNGTYPHPEEYMKLWRNDIWGKNLLEVDSHRSYRPLLATLFKMLVHGTGGLNPTNFRIVSIAFHCVATVWVAQLARHTFGSNTLGFSTAMLFASHPVHVEAVAAVVNLAEAASLIFYIFAYFIYKYGTINPSIQHSSSMIQYVCVFGGQLLLIVFWLCLVIVSVLFKETGITLCGVIVASSIIQLLSSVRTKCFLVVDRSSDNTTTSTWFAKGISVIQLWTIRHFLWVIACFYAVLLYFVFRTALIAPEGTFLSNLSILVSIDPQRWQQFHSNVGKAYLGESQLIRKAENPFSLLQGEERWLSMMYLHFRYFYQLLWPIELCAEYAFDCIPKVSSLTDPRAHYALFFYAMLLISILIGIYRLLIPSTYEKKANTKATVNTQTSIPSINTNENTIHQSHTSSDTNTTVQTANQQPKFSSQPIPLPDIIISPESFLQCMVWLVVPFIPASGLFLKLGTLLAERLLYAPSVGYCMLLTLVIHTLCHRMARLICMYVVLNDADVEYEIQQRQRHHWMVMIRLSLYWICIIIITIAYTYKTISQNPHWYNDETLHMHDWTICPRSAKLNTQIAKIHLNKGNLTQARFYLNHAMNIDPDFCDTGHQHALLLLFHEQDMESALNALADNLKCIYTNKQSFEVLHKVWDEQFSTPGATNNHQLMASQAKLALRGGLIPAAGKKYQAASILAFQAQHWEAALTYSIQAEEIIALMLKDTEGMNAAAIQVHATTTATIARIENQNDTRILQTLMDIYYPKKNEECQVTTTSTICIPMTTTDRFSQEQMTSFLLSYPRRTWTQPEERTEGAILLEMYGKTLTSSSTEHTVALMDLACNIYLSGARLREHIQHQWNMDEKNNNQKKKKKMKNSTKKTTFSWSTQHMMELKRVEELFYYAAQSHCVIILENRIVTDYASQALSALSESLMKRIPGGTQRIQEYVWQILHNEEEEEEENEHDESYDLIMAAYAQFSRTSSHVLQRLYYKYNPKTTTKEVDDLVTGYTNTKDTAITLWNAVGHALYRKGQYQGAIDAFMSSMATQWEGNQSPQPLCRSISSLLWFANVLAAIPDMLISIHQVTYAAIALHLIVVSSSECHDEHMIQKQATKQLHTLLEYIHEMSMLGKRQRD